MFTKEVLAPLNSFIIVMRLGQSELQKLYQKHTCWKQQAPSIKTKFKLSLFVSDIVLIISFRVSKLSFNLDCSYNVFSPPEKCVPLEYQIMRMWIRRNKPNGVLHVQDQNRKFTINSSFNISKAEIASWNIHTVWIAHLILIPHNRLIDIIFQTHLY